MGTSRTDGYLLPWHSWLWTLQTLTWNHAKVDGLEVIAIPMPELLDQPRTRLHILNVLQIRGLWVWADPTLMCWAATMGSLGADFCYATAYVFVI